MNDMNSRWISFFNEKVNKWFIKHFFRNYDASTEPPRLFKCFNVHCHRGKF